MTVQSLPPSGNRIEAIDVLRGFTLFGIALVHMVEQYYAGPPPDAVITAREASIADHVTDGFVNIFIRGKFFMIFSFLFGLSFFLQFSKRDGDSGFLLRFAWRLLVLFAIGFIHHLHYRGDILTIYALLGFSLLIFYKVPDRWLLVIALLLIFNIPTVVIRAVDLAFPSGGGNPFNMNQDELMAYYQTVKSGPYLDVLKANFYEFNNKMIFQVWSGRIYITLGLFLLGLYAGRKKLFENLAGHLPFLRKSLRYAWWSLGALVLIGVVLMVLAQALKVLSLPDAAWMLIGGFIYDLFNTVLAVIYVAGIAILMQKVSWQNRLSFLAPVGRMGLTTYLLQTAFGQLVFFGYGLGLGLLMDIGAFLSLALGLLFFAFQVWLAQYWFRYFTQGPFEWLWRTLTYFKAQPLLKQKTPVLAE